MAHLGGRGVYAYRGDATKIFFNFYKGVFMVDKLNAVVPLEGKDGKTYWHNVGKAFQNKLGGWDIIFNSLPIQTKSKDGSLVMKVMLLPPKDGPSSAPSPQPRQNNQFEDDIQF